MNTINGRVGGGVTLVATSFPAAPSAAGAREWRISRNLRPALLDRLFAPVTALGGIGPSLGRLVERAAGPLCVDLLWHLPTGLVDRRAAPRVADLTDGQIVTIKVEVVRHEAGMGRRPYRVSVGDGSGYMSLIYFNVKGDHLERLLPVGMERVVSGRVEFYGGIPQMAHPDYVVAPGDAERIKPIEPVYPLTAGLTPRVVQRAVATALERAPEPPEWLDPALQARRRWPRWHEALAAAHPPEARTICSPKTPARNGSPMTSSWRASSPSRWWRRGAGDGPGGR